MLNRFHDEHKWGCSQMGVQKARLPKICHTNSTMMKLDSYILPKEDLKNMVIILMMSAKMATLGVLKIRLF